MSKDCSDLQYIKDRQEFHFKAGPIFVEPHLTKVLTGLVAAVILLAELLGRETLLQLYKLWLIDTYPSHHLKCDQHS